MRTNIELNEDLLSQICKMGGFHTKKAAVNAALEEYSKFLKRQELLALEGKIQWKGNIDELRSMRARPLIKRKMDSRKKA
jgi:Arc/MetJ family transcription regulator